MTRLPRRARVTSVDGMRRGRLRVGTSGYEYEHWRGVFYPAGLSKRERFSFYAGRFDSVEINNTFYRLPSVETFERWREQAPPGFVYSLKFSRYATHMKRLRDPDGPIESFLDRSRHLGVHHGPILVQLPHTFRGNPGRLERFLEVAPKAYRWAFELRHDSWFCDEIYEILRGHDAALVTHDALRSHPRKITASWHYQRFHGGADERFSRQHLVAEARRVREELAAGRDAWVFFNNDEEGHAVMDARDFRRYVHGRPAAESRRGEAPVGRR